jgi:hypothetical protein
VTLAFSPKIDRTYLKPKLELPPGACDCHFHFIGPQKQPRPVALGVALPDLAASHRRDGIGQAGNRCPMASQWIPAPLALSNLPIDELFAIDRLVHGIEVTLERDLLGGMVEALITEPDPMTSLPNGSDISPAVAQEKALNALTCLSDRFDSDLTGPDEIAHRLVGLVGNPRMRNCSTVVIAPAP